MEERNYWKDIIQKRLSRRRLLRNAAIGGAGLAIVGGVGCKQEGGEAKPAPSSGQPKRGGILQTGMTDPVHWDPHQTTSFFTHLAGMWANETLLSYRYGPKYGSSDATPSPNMAESWEMPDDQTYIFKLVKGAKWQNRPPLNAREFVAEDVKFSFERIQRVKAPFRTMYEKIAKIEAPDKYTVKMTMSEPFAPILNFLAHYYSALLAPEVEEKFGDFKKPESLIGLGPFMLDSYVPNSSFVYKRNPDYFRSGLPYLDGVEGAIGADAAASLAAFRAEQRAIYGTTPAELPSIKATNPNIEVYEYIAVYAWHVNFRLDKAPYNDKRLRQALALSIDRQAWVDSLFMGKGLPDHGPIQALWKDWKVPTDQLGPGAEFYKYDPAKAKRLLAEAGYPDGLKASFIFTNGYGAPIVEQAELVKDFASKIGIQLDLKILEYGAFVNTVMRNMPTFDEMAFGGVRFMGDPDEALWDMFHPTGAKNMSRVDDPKVTEMIVKQRRTLNQTERKKIVYDIQKYLSEQCYYIYAPAQINIAVWHPWLKNFAPHFSYDNGSIYREVWIDK